MKNMLPLASLLLFPAIIQAQIFAGAVVNPFTISASGSRTSPAFADLDNDGDLDLFTGPSNGSYGFYENDGTVQAPSFPNSILVDPFNITAIGGNATPFLADLDNDGDYDCFAGGNGGFVYYENGGNAQAASYSNMTVSPFSIIPPTGIAKPYLVDLDGDGDLDILSGSSDGKLYYYENTGNAGSPSFAAQVANPFGTADVGSRSAPALSDLDADGDFDLLIGNEDGELYYYENTGTANAPAFDSIGAHPFNLQDIGNDAKPTFADLDGDGDEDLMVGSATGNYHYFENLAETLGVEEGAQAGFSIFPNPFSDFTTIDLAGFSGRDAQIVIIDMQGKQVYTRSLMPHSSQLTIPKSELPSGIYLVYLKGENKRERLGRIVVQ